MSYIKKITFSSLICAIYFIFCFVEQSFAFGIIQCRFAEALTLMCLFFPSSIIGITLGCLLFNLTIGSFYDIIFGTLVTLISCLITLIVGKYIKNDKLRILFGGLPHVILNAVIIPFIISFTYGEINLYWYYFITILLGEIIAIYIFGSLIYRPLKNLLKKLAV